MVVVKAKIYTKTGDRGETALVGGTRVRKSNLRLEAYGTLDELNSAVGLLRATMQSKRSFDLEEGGDFSPDFYNMIQPRLQMIQNNLFNIGSHLACPDAALQAKLPPLQSDLISLIEKDMDDWESELPALRNFILPGGSRPAAVAHIARTICRRAEREMVRIDENMLEIDMETERIKRGSTASKRLTEDTATNIDPKATHHSLLPKIPAEHLVFVNRLSDWFFLLARKLNAVAGIEDVLWDKGAGNPPPAPTQDSDNDDDDKTEVID